MHKKIFFFIVFLTSVFNAFAENVYDPASIAEFFPFKEVPVSVLSDYSVHQRPVANPYGILTITTNAISELGDVIYAQVLSEILASAYPEQKIRVIIELDHDRLKKVQDKFKFPPSVEVLYAMYHDFPQQEVIESLKEASLVIVASTEIMLLKNGRYQGQTLKLGELACVEEGYEMNFEAFKGVFDNYRQLQPFSRHSVDWNDFAYNYWKKYSFTLAFDLMSNLIDARLAPNVSLLDITKQLFEDYEKTSPCPHLRTNKVRTNKESNQNNPPDSTKTFPESNHAFGLEPNQLGIVLNPLLLENLSNSSELITGTPLGSQFQQLLSERPELEELILNEEGTPEFFMAYMHTNLGFAEFFSIASELSSAKPPVILSNFDEGQIQDESFRMLMANQGISSIDYIDLTDNETNTNKISRHEISNRNGRTITLVRPPFIEDDFMYHSLFAHAQQPVGVTGNHSLFNAIALKKIPIYDITHPFQHGVNKSLRRFDSSKRLHSIFDNRFLPKEKAFAIVSASHEVTRWSDNIMGNKVANKILVTMIDYLIESNSSFFHHMKTLENESEVTEAVSE